MRQVDLTFEIAVILCRISSDRSETEPTFQEILDTLPKMTPEQIEKDWQEAKRYYGVS